MVDTFKLCELKTRGVSLVKRGANRKRFAIFKSIDAKACEEIAKMLPSHDALVGVIAEEMDGEPSIEGLEDEARDALHAVYRLLAKFNERIPREAAMAIFRGVFGEEPESESAEEEEPMEEAPADVEQECGQDWEVRKELEDLRKEASDARELLEKEVDNRKLREHIEKAREEFKFYPADPKDIGTVMHKLSKSDESLAQGFARILKASSDALSQSVLLKAEGSDAQASAHTAMDRIEQIAKELCGESTPKSRAKALEAHPELYTQYMKEVRG